MAATKSQAGKSAAGIMSKLPYSAEYAKSGKSSCKGCRQLIENQSLRLAIMVQSPFFDGMQPNWFHPRCFFARTKLKNVDQVAHFQNLRWDDQEELRSKIEGAGTANGNGVDSTDSTSKTKGKGKSKGSKRAASSDSSLPADIHDYTVQYAKSGRSKCKVCEVMIPKDEVRISKKDYEGETAKRYGPVDQWHHVDCFIRAREELQFFAAGTVLPGYMTLSPDDQKEIKKKLPAIEGAAEVSPPKKTKVEDSGLMETMKKQNEEMFALRDKLQDIPKRDLILLLENNKIPVPEGIDRILDLLADHMTFGSIPPCGKCQGQIVFKSGVGYQCKGNITEWTKCEAIYEKPKRTVFKVHKSLKADYSFLASYKSKIQERAFRKAVIETETKKETKPPLPLTGLNFLIQKTTADVEDVKKAITSLGGKISKSFSPIVNVVISLQSEIDRAKPLKAMKSAKDTDVPVLAEDFVFGVTPTTSRDDIIKIFNEKKLSSWGCDISGKLAFDTVDGAKSVYPSKSASATAAKSIFKSDVGTQKLCIKDGLTVDPDSKLEQKAHVYRQNRDIYSTVLSITDLQAQKNSYYKLQVLEADKGNKAWLFRSWGRIGTTIGGNKTEQYSTLGEAIHMFEQLFEEKTGNDWWLRDKFSKVPGKMMMLDVVQGCEKVSTKVQLDKSSGLPQQVQELMCLIFDIEAMQNTMMEFELDLKKMPLGKLSQKQIKDAFSLLTKLQTLRSDGADRSLIIDNTNRFYTLVPHDFGIENPPILDNDEVINQKIDMLNSLLDIEIAYKLLEAAGDTSGSPIEAHYKKLKANITVVDKESDEFASINTYVKNTHANTHRHYDLIIQDVFKINREGEEERYKAFQKLPNRMLLWHGSRVTNFAGILSQGLRIAPPEAPMTGYMFGKGIYFADMVSKSANYCMTTSKNNTGLLLLCEVALGNMNCLKNAKDVKKPPKGTHSVKGVGRTQPDPSVTGVTPTGALIPYGKGKDSKEKDTSLLYNEYIVYDVNQVNIKYLVRMNFKYQR